MEVIIQLGFFDRRPVREPAKETRTDRQKRGTETDGGFRVGNQDPSKRGLGREDGRYSRDHDE